MDNRFDLMCRMMKRWLAEHPQLTVFKKRPINIVDISMNITCAMYFNGGNPKKYDYDIVFRYRGKRVDDMAEEYMLIQILKRTVVPFFNTVEGLDYNIMLVHDGR